MFHQATKKIVSCCLRQKEFRFKRCSSNYAFETISCEDPSVFPAESGIIQNSIYGNEITFPKCTLDQYVWMDTLAKFRHKTAIECGITGRSYTYEKLRDHCATFAVNLLKKLHLRNRDTISMCLPNMPEFAIVALGSIEAGLVLSTLNPIYTSDEIAKQIKNSDTKVLIGTIENYETLAKAVKLANSDIKIILVKTESGQSLPQQTIDFFDLINTSSKYSMYFIFFIN